jgi:hypothetical protein
MENILVFINTVCLIVAILVVWFQSNAFVEYCKLFGLKKILLGYEDDTNNLTFPYFLLIKKNILFQCSICKFLIMLITCPICLGFWLSIVGACLTFSILYTPVYYITSLFVYFLLTRILN